MQRQAFTSVLIQDDQKLQGTAVGGPVVDEVPGPYLIRGRGRTDVAGIGIDSNSPLFTLSSGYLKVLLLPKPVDPFVVDAPAILLLEHRDLATTSP